MSIKSDKWIKRMCTRPEHMAQRSDNGLWEYSSLSRQELSQLIVDRVYDRFQRVENHPGILPEWKPMIEPFSPTQVRTRLQDAIVRSQNGELPTGNSFDGDPEWNNQKIISWGTTSMGYDVRLAEDFRIFSNINSAVVDPKRFDENCLIEGKLQEGEFGEKYVIIPPNSYLLSHTIEVFNIPRDILVVAVGKSTMARSGAIVNVTPIEPGFQGTVVIEISNSTPSPLKIYANEGISQFLFYQSDEDCEVSYADRQGKYQNQRGIVLPKT